MCCKVCCLRQINTTGNLRMADMCDLPAGRTSIAVVARAIIRYLSAWHIILRQGGAALLLSFAIIGGGFVTKEATSANAFKSSPAKSGLMSGLHEIQVRETAIEPKCGGAAPDLVMATIWKIDPQIDGINLKNIRPYTRIDGKGPCLSIDRICGEFVANGPSECNFNREGLGTSLVFVADPHDTKFFRSASEFYAVAETPVVRINDHYRQLDGNGGSSAQISGICGDAGGLIRASYEYPLPESNKDEAAREHSKPPSIISYSFVGTRLGGFLLGMLLSGGFWFCVWWKYR